MSLKEITKRDEEIIEHTSDDSALIMESDNNENAPLINNRNHNVTLRENVFPSQSFTESTHCHVPEVKFDYGSRNRLVIVLIVCLIFMLIEIIGM